VNCLLLIITFLLTEHVKPFEPVSLICTKIFSSKMTEKLESRSTLTLKNMTAVGDQLADTLPA
jgi:hypothetical protein